MRVNRSQLAEALSVSLPTVDRLIAEGLPCERRGARGLAFAFELEDCERWYRDRAGARALERAMRSGKPGWIEAVTSQRLSAGGLARTVDGAELASLLEWTWPDVLECVGHALPFVEAGPRNDPKRWRFSIAHVLHWLALVGAMLDHFAVDAETAALPVVLRHVRGDELLQVPKGFQRMARPSAKRPRRESRP